jgi:hypothetical protein
VPGDGFGSPERNRPAEQRELNDTPTDLSLQGTLMSIRCQKIRLLVNDMELDLHLDATSDRHFAVDKFKEWGYEVVAVRDGAIGIPNVVTISVGGNDDQGIIDKMCNQPEFDVKC